MRLLEADKGAMFIGVFFVCLFVFFFFPQDFPAELLRWFRLWFYPRKVNSHERTLEAEFGALSVPDICFAALACSGPGSSLTTQGLLQKL